MIEARVMGELVFLRGRREAEAIGAKLEAAGFGIFISDYVDDIDDELPTAFAMVWKDCADMNRRVAEEFATAVDAIVLQQSIITVSSSPVTYRQNSATSATKPSPLSSIGKHLAATDGGAFCGSRSAAFAARSMRTF